MSSVVVVEDVLAERLLQGLRTDCQRIQSDLGIDLTETSCYVDPLELLSLPENDPARLLPEAYLAARFGPSSDVESKGCFASVTLTILPRLLRRLLGFSSVFLFNENYIVKPGPSNVAFRWHRDSDEQLSCLPPPSRPRYVSCWCPLDDTNQLNGTLTVSSRTRVLRVRYGDIATAFDRDSIQVTCDGEPDWCPDPGQPIEVRRGSVVVFSSLEWHCSGANGSAADRRVFYAQYSDTPILSPPEGLPLSFAIPCGGRSNE